MINPGTGRAEGIDPLTVVSVARVDGQTWAVLACGCAVRLSQDMESTGRTLSSLLDHAADVARGERGGCLPAQPGTRINPGRPR